MFCSLPLTLLLASHTLALAITVETPSSDLESRAAPKCSIVNPSGFWQIYSQDQQRSTDQFITNPQGADAEFAVSQDDGKANKLDLIASFTNVPCPPAGVGPYQIQFLYSNSARTGYDSGGNDVIDMFAITGALPVSGPFRLYNLHFQLGTTIFNTRKDCWHVESTQAKKTWASLRSLTGSLIGTFHLPRDDEDPSKSRLIYKFSPMLSHDQSPVLYHQ